MEHRLHLGLQVQVSDRLGDPVRDRGDGGLILHLLQP